MNELYNCKKERFLNIMYQFIKFGIVGFSNTLISLGVYYVLVYFGVNYILSNAMGFVVSVINSFYWNNKYVFTDKSEENVIRAFIKVFISYGGSFILSTILIYLMVDILGISKLIAPLIRLIITVPLNFLMNKMWAFQK